MILAGDSPRITILAYVWPEPDASAAGVRVRDLIRIFQDDARWQVSVLSPAMENPFTQELRAAGVFARQVQANDPCFDGLIRELRPEVVLFDRFVTEEQFGWRVREQCPGAVNVLDLEDLHFLRRARQRAIEQGGPGCSPELEGRDALREIASIYRSDLSLIISDFETELLRERFRVPAELLLTLGFTYLPAPETTPSFAERSDFTVLGNFRHPPNSDGVRWLASEIWPRIRSLRPDAQVHVYGAYPSREMMALNSLERGFFVHGKAADALGTLSRYRVNLAPLRFGAGIKGKIADGWRAGTPCVTTPIGAEGMRLAGEPFGGEITEIDAEAFARAAVRLLEDPEHWNALREAGRRILSEKFSRERNGASLLSAIDRLRSGPVLADHRRGNFVGAMLRHHLHQSTKYFSKWIEAKQARAAEAAAVPSPESADGEP